jgi:hypothetical protein
MPHTKPIEVLAVTVVAGLAFAIAYYLSTHTSPTVFTRYDVWYGSDIPRVVANMTDVTSDHFRTKVHPIFSFLILPLTKIVSALPGVNLQGAVPVTVALAAALSVALVYGVVRRLSGQILPALLAAAFMCSSAGFIFWAGIPETYIFGSAGIAAVLFVTLTLPARTGMHVGLQVVALAFTTTNWMVALLASYARFPLLRAIGISLAGLVIVVVVAVWQKALIPSSGIFFLPQAVSEEPAYIVPPTLQNLPIFAERAANFLAAAIVAPASELSGGVLRSTLQFGPLGWLGLIGWIALLGGGIMQAMRMEQRRIIGIVVGGFLGFQFCLHLLYGDEPFLYALHSLPALVILAALSLIGRYGKVFALVMAVSVLCNVANNSTRFFEASALAATLGP